MVTSRIWFTAKQKSGLWERWKSGQSVLAISRALERRNKTGVQGIVALHGGIGSPSIRSIRAVHKPDDGAPAPITARDDVLGCIGVAEHVHHLALSVRRASKQDFVSDGELDIIIRQFNRLASAHHEKG